MRGLELSKLYYDEIVGPILTSKFPGLEYSAGLLGKGSEVLGYDTEQSMDHNWGLRLMIFLPEKDFEKSKKRIDLELRRSLPLDFMGYPTSFGKPDKKTGVRLADHSAGKAGNANHYVVFQTPLSFSKDAPDPEKIADWLAIPQQKLLEMTSGRLFYDGLRLEKAIEEFQYFPRDIWLYMMASQWSKISQEEAFVARAGSLGEDMGSRIIATRIVKELMELCFLMERKYWPYSKWFGTAFSGLKSAADLGPVLLNVLRAESIGEREKALSVAYEITARKHNSLKITRKIPARVSKFYERPYLVIHADRFANEIRKKISDKTIRALPLIGSIDQITDNPNVLLNVDLLRKLQIVFGVPIS